MDPLNSLEEPVDPTVHDLNETRLWRATILQALVDATEYEASLGTSAALARDQARAWFFASSASTRRNFEDVCDMADLNPFAVRGMVKRALAEGRKIHRSQLTAALRLPDNSR
jgi:hypothetical protein